MLKYTANDVYVIRGIEDQEYLIPALKQFVPVVDIENGKIIITPIKGMID